MTYFDLDYYINQTAYGQIFNDVQMAGIFADSKTFADCQLLAPVQEIISAYALQKK